MAPVFRSPRAQHAACSKATWRRSAGGIARFSARTAAGCWRRGSCAPPSALGWSMMRPGSRATPLAARAIATTNWARWWPPRSDRGRLLAAWFLRAPECAWMVDDAAGVKGYTFGRPGYRYHQLGPVVAANAATAQDMVIRCLSPLGGGAC